MGQLAGRPLLVVTTTCGVSIVVTVALVLAAHGMDVAGVVTTLATLWALVLALVIYLLTARDTDKLLGHIDALQDQLSAALAVPGAEAEVIEAGDVVAEDAEGSAPAAWDNTGDNTAVAPDNKPAGGDNTGWRSGADNIPAVPDTRSVGASTGSAGGDNTGWRSGADNIPAVPGTSSAGADARSADGDNTPATPGNTPAGGDNTGEIVGPNVPEVTSERATESMVDWITRIGSKVPGSASELHVGRLGSDGPGGDEPGVDRLGVDRAGVDRHDIIGPKVPEATSEPQSPARRGEAEHARPVVPGWPGPRSPWAQLIDRVPPDYLEALWQHAGVDVEHIRRAWTPTSDGRGPWVIESQDGGRWSVFQAGHGKPSVISLGNPDQLRQRRADRRARVHRAESDARKARADARRAWGESSKLQPQDPGGERSGDGPSQEPLR